jgi:hypothetical protein
MGPWSNRSLPKLHVGPRKKHPQFPWIDSSHFPRSPNIGARSEWVLQRFRGRGLRQQRTVLSSSTCPSLPRWRRLPQPWPPQCHGAYPHHADLPRGEFGMLSSGFLDRRLREFGSVGRVRAEGAEDEEAIQIGRAQLGASCSLHSYGDQPQLTPAYTRVVGVCSAPGRTRYPSEDPMSSARCSRGTAYRSGRVRRRSDRGAGPFESGPSDFRVRLARRSVGTDIGRSAIELLEGRIPAACSGSAGVDRVSSMSKSTTTGLATRSGLLLVVAAETLAHGREDLVSEVVKAPRGEA